MLHFQLPSLISNENIWTIFGLINTFGIKVLFLIYCWKSGFNLKNTVFLLVSVTTGSAIGSVILPSFLGALLGASLFAVGTIRYLSIRDNYFGPLAVMALVTLAISRIGCFLSGCCFGSVAGDLPGIIYGTHSFAHLLHSELGIVHGSHSLPVHPIQLYESIWLIIAAVLVHRTSKKITNSLTLIPLALAYLFAGRFVIEFFRDMTNIWWSVKSFAGISLLQWFCALITVVTGSIFVRFKNQSIKQHNTSERSSIPLVAILYTAVLVFQNRIVDQLVIQLVILLPLASIIALSPQFQRFTAFRPVVQAVALVLLIVPILPRTLQVIADDPNSDSSKTWIYEIDSSHQKLVRVGQTEDSPEKIDSIRALIGIVHDSIQPILPAEASIEPLSANAVGSVTTTIGKKEKQLIIRGSTGYYLNSLTDYESDGSCGGPSITRTYNNTIPGIGISVGNKTIEPGKPTVQFTGDILFASNRWDYSYEHSDTAILDTARSGMDMFNSYGGSFKIDGKYIGGGFGVFITDIPNIPYKSKVAGMIPRAHFRAGSPKYHFWSDVGGIESAILFPNDIRVGQGHTIHNVTFHYGNWLTSGDLGGFLILDIPIQNNGSVVFNGAVAGKSNSFGITFEKGIPLKK